MPEQWRFFKEDRAGGTRDYLAGRLNKADNELLKLGVARHKLPFFHHEHHAGRTSQETFWPYSDR